MNPTNKQPVTFQGDNIPTQGTPAYAQAQQGIVPQGFGGAVTSASLAPSNPINIPPTPTQPPPITPYVPPPAGTVVNNGIATVPPPAVQTPPQSAYQGILNKLGIAGDALAQKADATKQLQDQYQLSQKTEQAAKDYNAYVAAREGMNQGIATMSTTNPGNLPADSRQQEISDYQLKKSFEVANYSIAAQGSQGLLSAAQQTIKDKLDAQFGPVEDQINYLTKVAQLNKNDLTDSEQIKLQALIDQKKQDVIDTKEVSKDIHDRLYQNNAPPSVYSALDDIANNFSQGKITAQDAQNQMYQAAGKYGATNKYSVVTNPFTGEQSAFDTTTGQFKGQNGQPIPTTQLSGDIKLATSTINSTAPIISNGVVTHPPTGNIVVDTAQQLIDGNTTPSLIPKRGVVYNAILEKANELSYAQTGKPYSPVDAAAAYKFRTSGTYTKFIANAPVAMSTINTIVDDAKKLNLNGPDLFNSFQLKTMASGFNPFVSQEDRATAKELINTLGSISADDIGLLLGSGSGSDYKTKLGSAIFDVSGNLRTTEQIAQTVNARIQSKLDDYYRIAGVKDPSIYSKRDTQAITGSAGTTNTNTNSATITSEQARSQYGY